jgi:Cof subfamily protein (haloacid dehalogenase superfamily)
MSATDKAAGRAGDDGLIDVDLLISDVDGTLVRPDKSLSDTTIAAVRALRAAGRQFTMISSRPPRGVLPLVRQLGLDVPFAGFNGGAIAAPDGKVVEFHPIPAAAARIALDMFSRTPAEIFVFADDQWLLTDPNGHYVPLERRTLGFDYTLVDSFDSYVDRIGKIVAASPDPALLAGLEADLNPRIAPGAHAMRSQTYYLDVNASDANKGVGAERLARQIGVPLERTAVIGDGANDVPMFERVRYSIAMGQAEEAVRERAWGVTGSNADDGLAAAIQRYLLPEKTHG